MPIESGPSGERKEMVVFGGENRNGFLELGATGDASRMDAQA
jgi:hypothetical protein